MATQINPGRLTASLAPPLITLLACRLLDQCFGRGGRVHRDVQHRDGYRTCAHRGPESANSICPDRRTFAHTTLIPRGLQPWDLLSRVLISLLRANYIT